MSFSKLKTHPFHYSEKQTSFERQKMTVIYYDGKLTTTLPNITQNDFLQNEGKYFAYFAWSKKWFHCCVATTGSYFWFSNSWVDAAFIFCSAVLIHAKKRRTDLHFMQDRS